MHAGGGRRMPLHGKAIPASILQMRPGDPHNRCFNHCRVVVSLEGARSMSAVLLFMEAMKETWLCNE
jgi:hypothetical protein